MSTCSHPTEISPGSSCSACLRVCVGDHCVLLSPSATGPKSRYRKRTPLHEEIARYYEDPYMQKTENKGGFSIYAVRVSCLTVCDGEKYIIAIVPRDPAPDGARYRLSELVWVSFQTQYLPEGRYSVAQIRLEPKTREWIADRCAAIVQPISAAGRNMGKTWYSADPPQATPIGWWINRIEVEHKHKNSAFELPDTSTLYLALNMFRTTIILRGVECKAPENDTRVAAPNVDSTNRRHRAGKKNAGRLVSANIVSHLPEPDTGRF